MKAELERRAKIAWGIALIALVFLLETTFAHHKYPSPASPFVWALLGTIAAVAVGYGLWCRARARSAGDAR